MPAIGLGHEQGFELGGAGGEAANEANEEQGGAEEAFHDEKQYGGEG